MFVLYVDRILVAFVPFQALSFGATIKHALDSCIRVSHGFICLLQVDPLVVVTESVNNLAFQRMSHCKKTAVSFS